MVSRLFRPRVAFWLPKTWRARTRDRGGRGANGNFSALICDFFPIVRNSRPGKCGPRTAAGRTSQFRGPHYNANFLTLGGPQFMTSRAAFGPRAALFTPLHYIKYGLESRTGGSKGGRGRSYFKDAVLQKYTVPKVIYATQN